MRAAVAELRLLLSHTADGLDDILPMRAAALLVEVYLRQGSGAKAAGAAQGCATAQQAVGNIVLFRQITHRARALIGFNLSIYHHAKRVESPRSQPTETPLRRPP